MRGKRLEIRALTGAERITPAGAGKTHFADNRMFVIKDHPRRCGENRRLHQLPSPHRGSPPQVRGKLIERDVGIYCRRITPAGAGKTKTKKMSKGYIKDHPRRCGENWYSVAAYSRCRGSPPQVRGKRPDKAQYLKEDRITPAGAGKTKSTAEKATACWDHPRRCGENQRRCCKLGYGLGSPPQVRGKH